MARPLLLLTAMKTILIVDDEVEIAKALRRLLRKEFEVEVAHTGADALTRLEQGAVDLVLTDFRMPAMNGSELLAEVKRRWPTTVRVMLSGYADLESSVDEGATCRFIRKPWDDRVLLSTLGQLLSGSGAEEANR